MRMKALRTLMTTCLLSASFAAHGATLSLSPSAQTAVVGDAITLTVSGEFGAAGTLGGGFDIFYDSTLLQFVSFEFAASLMDDPAFRRDPDLLAGELNGIAFGEFDGYTGNVLIGEVTFLALDIGIVDISMLANEGGPPDNPGPFVDILGNVITDLQTTGAQLTLQPVPLPGAVWLLLGGLLTLVGGSRLPAAHETPG